MGYRTNLLAALGTVAALLILAAPCWCLPAIRPIGG